MTGLGDQGREGDPPFYRARVEPWHETNRPKLDTDKTNLCG